MKSPQFKISNELHSQLTTICRQLDYDRPNFYAACLKLACNELESNPIKLFQDEITKSIAAKIIEKIDRVTGEHEFSVEFLFKQYTVNCSGKLVLDYRLIHPETRVSQAEYELSYIDLILGNSPEIYLGETEITHDIGFWDIEKELINQI